MSPSPEASYVEKIVTWGVLAGLGGAAKYVSTVMRSSENVTNRRFLMLLLANVFVSSFCGLMGAMLVSTFTMDIVWHGLAAGMFGYMGTQGLDFVMLALKKKVDPGAPVSAVMPIPPSIDQQ